MSNVIDFVEAINKKKSDMEKLGAELRDEESLDIHNLLFGIMVVDGDIEVLIHPAVSDQTSMQDMTELISKLTEALQIITR